MKVIKNINNNISLCLDSRNNEVVAFGKGIGFTKPPYDVPLSKIDRTFYDVDEEQLAVLKRIPEDVLEAAAEIVDLANEKMDNQFRENVVFTLADHIDFAIQRYRKNINIKLPLLYEVRQLYPGESELGRQALDILKKRLKVSLRGKKPPPSPCISSITRRRRIRHRISTTVPLSSKPRTSWSRNCTSRWTGTASITTDLSPICTT